MGRLGKDTIYNTASSLYDWTTYTQMEIYSERRKNIRWKCFWLEKYKPKVFIFHSLLCLSIKIVLLKINCVKKKKNKVMFQCSPWKSPSIRHSCCFTSILRFFLSKSRTVSKALYHCTTCLFLWEISIGMSPCRDKSGNCCNALLN